MLTRPQNFDTDILRYSYQSLATPSSVIDFNMKTKGKEIKKEQEVLGGKFDKNNYIEERVWATATDGANFNLGFKGLKKTVKSIVALCVWFVWSYNGYVFHRHVCLF
jgi:oligopeptidase B